MLALNDQTYACQRRCTIPGHHCFEATYEILGTTFRVSSASRVGTDLERLLAPFPPAAAEVPESRHFRLVEEPPGPICRLYRGRDLLWSSLERRLALGSLLAFLNAAAIDGFSGFAAHAGVVADADNRAIACMAASGTGKSTLVAASLSAGFSYVSDEALCVSSEEGAVLTYPKPLQLSTLSCQVLRLPDIGGEDEEINLTHGDFRTPIATPPISLAHIVRLVRRPGDAELRDVPQSRGVAWLLERSFNHYKRPQQSFHIVAELASRSHAWELAYEEAADAVLLIKKALPQRPVRPFPPCLKSRA